MMNLNPINPVIVDTIGKISAYTENYKFAGNDYDQAFFQIFTIQKKLQFSFRYPHFKEIYSTFPPAQLQQQFPSFKQNDKPNEGFDITFEIDISKYVQDQEGNEETNKKNIDTENEEATKKFLNKIGQEIAIFRAAFLSGPFERTFNDIIDGKQLTSLNYELRPTENVWIIPSQQMATVYFTLNFSDSLERQLIKLVLTEMEEARRHVPNPPSVSKLMEDTYPEALASIFPDLKGKKLEKCCMIGITLVKQNHFGDAKSARIVAQLLSGFRQYLHYHIHGMKTYLHGRIRRKVANLEKMIKQAKFEEESTVDKSIRVFEDDDNVDSSKGIHRI